MQLKGKKASRPHQAAAIEGFQASDQGKLTMACAPAHRTAHRDERAGTVSHLLIPK